MENKKLDLDSFGEVMDTFIKDNDIGMLINMPAGTVKPEIEDNAKLGPVIQFYIMLNALPHVMKAMIDLMGIHKENCEGMIDSLLELVKADLMDMVNEEAKEEEMED